MIAAKQPQQPSQPRTVTIMGIRGQMDAAGADAICCMRVEDVARPPIPGCRQEPCAECGRPVWVSPSSQYARQQRPELLLHCVPCVKRLQEKEQRDATHTN